MRRRIILGPVGQMKNAQVWIGRGKNSVATLEEGIHYYSTFIMDLT
jgi:hypothetical protein